ncbi:MAG: DUF4405 domain-containing protein [Dehalococcoidia bacterium]|nr:DUF4405 domain-containing protein [Dehalococcoidia bacterium]
MKRALTNYIADILILIVLLSQVFTGIILHRFPAELTGTTVLGLTRYTWGTLHWGASLLFIIVIVLHLVLYWGWIKSLTNKYFKRGSLLLLSLVAIIFLFVCLAPYYATRDLPRRDEFSGIYRETTYNESERIQKELGGVSNEPHFFGGPWRISPAASE